MKSKNRLDCWCGKNVDGELWLLGELTDVSSHALSAPIAPSAEYICLAPCDLLMKMRCPGASLPCSL